MFSALFERVVVVIIVVVAVVASRCAGGSVVIVVVYKVWSQRRAIPSLVWLLVVVLARTAGLALA